MLGRYRSGRIDNSTIDFEVQKTCSAAALTEDVPYSITGHL
jgi:hypothetical protein